MGHDFQRCRKIALQWPSAPGPAGFARVAGEGRWRERGDGAPDTGPVRLRASQQGRMQSPPAP